jgi:hypothetical protein
VVNVQAQLNAADASQFTSLEGASFALSSTGYTALALQTGWTNAPFSTRNAAASSSGGIVRLQGAIAGTTTATTAVFNLPSGMAPPTSVYTTVDMISAAKGRLIISSSGAVTVQAQSGTLADAQGFTSLEGVWFPLTATGYTPMTLINGFSMYSTTRAVAASAGGGIVRLQGGIMTGGTTLSPFVLPVGFRPSANVYVPVDLCTANKGRLNITPDGSVTVQPETSGTTGTGHAMCFVSLERVFFGL